MGTSKLTEKSQTLVSVNPYVIHHSLSIFGPDADTFNPYRWLITPLNTTKSLERYLIPFGMGYNACPGRNLAMLEFNKIATTLVRDFEILEAEPQTCWRFSTVFITVPGKWKCILKRRAASMRIGGEQVQEREEMGTKEMGPAQVKAHDVEGNMKVEIKEDIDEAKAVKIIEKGENLEEQKEEKSEENAGELDYAKTQAPETTPASAPCEKEAANPDPPDASTPT